MPKGYKRPNGPTLLRLTGKQIAAMTHVAHELGVRLLSEARTFSRSDPLQRKALALRLWDLRRARQCMEYLNPSRRQCADCGLVKRVGAFYHKIEEKYGARASVRCKRCYLDREAWKRSDRKRRLKLSQNRDRKNASEATDA